MKYSISDKITNALNQAKQHNGNLMVKPEVILWPDPESQWASIIPELQKTHPALLIYGIYDPIKNQGPAIWIKCMVAQMLPEAKWEKAETPIIYLPGIAKNDLKNVENAGLDFQPLIEYQYTGTVFTQENGREWTISAIIQNPSNGLGLKIAQDVATKEALKKVLPSIFEDPEVLLDRPVIDSTFLNNQLFPNIISNILKWMCKGDTAIAVMDQGSKEVFFSLSKSEYDFEPDHKNIKAIAEKLGSQRNSWKHVWQHYINAPHRYPEIEELLRLAKPADLGTGMFAFPEESWPQVNEAKEDQLRESFISISKLPKKDVLPTLNALAIDQDVRKNWVWAELGYAPLLNSLPHILKMTEQALVSYPSSSIDDLKDYYIKEGYIVDQSMRQSFAAVKTEKEKLVIKSLITEIYKHWLEAITQKFQTLVEKDASIFTGQKAIVESESYVLFVDAFRYELAEEFTKRLKCSGFNAELTTSWSAIPSVTPTAKPNVSPIAPVVSTSSIINEFRPQLQSGKDLQTQAFRDSLTANNYNFIAKSSDIIPGKSSWQEIGDIDTKGHQEQSAMVKRVEELFEKVLEVIEVAFQRGVKRIKIVTDHGWLLLPGGLPKTQLNAGLTETRWGRCALIKEGASTGLLHLPWRWNPAIFIAYAPGISFFKVNEEYAHGGISIHECLVPVLLIENKNAGVIAGEIKSVKWVNLKCTIITNELPDGCSIDIRTKYNDPNTSIVLSKNKTLKDNTVFLMVEDSAEYQSATIVLSDEKERIIDKKPTTVGG
jgi:hypothetical protein